MRSHGNEASAEDGLIEGCRERKQDWGLRGRGSALELKIKLHLKQPPTLQSLDSSVIRVTNRIHPPPEAS